MPYLAALTYMQENISSAAKLKIKTVKLISYRDFVGLSTDDVDTASNLRAGGLREKLVPVAKK